MRKFIAALGVAGVMGLSAVSSPFAAPVPGFEALYQAVFAACTGATPDPAACEAAINAYSGALVAAGVDPEIALQSFIELRAEVVAAGGGDVIEALFEELLPESGAVPAASPV